MLPALLVVAAVMMQCITALGALRAAGDARRSTAHRPGIALLAGVLSGVVVFALPAAWQTRASRAARRRGARGL